VRLHVVLPNETPDVDPDDIVDLACEAERLGYAGVYLSDHLLPPAPYGDGPYNGVYEPLITLSYVAAATTRLRVGTSILVLAMRDPVVVAKQVATLNRLSHGRVTLGVGLGWSEEEFANVHAGFHDRAARTDEALALMRRLWDHGEGPFDGEHYGFERGHFQPAPGEGLRVLVGGTSEAALRRAARTADLWQSPPIEPSEFAQLTHTLREHATRPIETGGRLQWDDPDMELDTVLARIEAWERTGADELAVFFGRPSGFAHRMAAVADARSLNGVPA
jgi:probable F420-dependent oxidoreductase